ncbi:MAG TPA: hypothetical protein PLM07_09905 [Candidatus Rifleibacterium sp.]|nr:hypothetical protein [Candidatus Rifleibacterium sp.]HPT46201.1 hypothetical protein [Candidatus Rifleibacterium sp.]
MQTELRLPRMVESDPRGAEILKLMTANQRKLWQKSNATAVFLPFNDHFINALQIEHKRGRLVRGFEGIERSLEIQAHGLGLVDEKSKEQRGSRVSRLLILSNDGAERFLRKVEGLLKEHGDRVLGLVIDADSEKLGPLFFGEGKAAKLLMLEHKESVANALFALVKEPFRKPAE